MHHGDAATDKATRLVGAAAAKAKQLNPLDPIRVEAKGHATVIGGGIAGLRVAKDLATRGLEVALIEKSPFLGGRAAQLDRVAPTGEKVSELIAEIAHEVLSEAGITVYTCARVTDCEGYGGDFKLHLKRQPSESAEDQEKIKEMNKSGKGFGEFIPFAGICPAEIPESSEEVIIETGVIVLATGFKPYAPRHGEYGYGEDEKVITLPELIRIMAENQKNGDFLSVKGKEIKSVAMIHCVGSRQIPGVHEENEAGHLNEYCSRTCCGSTLHAANLIRETYPGTRVFEIYRDIRT